MLKRLLCGFAAILLLIGAAGCREKPVEEPTAGEMDGENLEHNARSKLNSYSILVRLPDK